MSKYESCDRCGGSGNVGTTAAFRACPECDYPARDITEPQKDRSAASPDVNPDQSEKGEPLADWYHQLKETHDRKCPYCNGEPVHPAMLGNPKESPTPTRELEQAAEEAIEANTALTHAVVDMVRSPTGGELDTKNPANNDEVSSCRIYQSETAKNNSSTNCNCICHSPLSSCPSCVHCERAVYVAEHNLTTRLRDELLEQIGPDEPVKVSQYGYFDNQDRENARVNAERARWRRIVDRVVKP